MANYVVDVEELSQSSVEINVEEESKKLKEIVTELKYRIQKDNLTALSAPQIGEKYRIFCIKFKANNKKKDVEVIHTFVNPVVIGIKGLVIDREEDICIPGKQFIIPRNNELSLIYQDANGKSITQKYVGKTVAVIQLMMDHLDGVLLSDIGFEIDEKFDEATDEERNEFLDAYINSLDTYKDELNSYIEGNEELKSMKDAVEFIQSVRAGETHLGDPITVDTSAIQKEQL